MRFGKAEEMREALRRGVNYLGAVVGGGRYRRQLVNVIAVRPDPADPKRWLLDVQMPDKTVRTFNHRQLI